MAWYSAVKPSVFAQPWRNVAVYSIVLLWDTSSLAGRSLSDWWKKQQKTIHILLTCSIGRRHVDHYCPFVNAGENLKVMALLWDYRGVAAIFDEFWVSSRPRQHGLRRKLPSREKLKAHLRIKIEYGASTQVWSALCVVCVIVCKTS